MKNLKEHNINFLFYVFICISLIIFSHNYPEKFNQPRSIIISTLQPVINILSKPSLWVHNAYQNTLLHYDTINSNKKLIQENKILKQWHNKSIVLEQENSRLRKLLGSITKNQSDPILVQPFTDANSPFSRSILINAGSDSGISKGQEVVNYQGLVGRIIKVYKNTARVLLITDSTFRVPSRILETRSRALIKGTNTNKLELMLVENSRAKIYSDMTVVTSGMGGTFLPDIPIGTIKKSGDIYTIIPDVDFSKLENLIVHRHKMKNILQGDTNE